MIHKSHRIESGRVSFLQAFLMLLAMELHRHERMQRVQFSPCP